MIKKALLVLAALSVASAAHAHDSFICMNDYAQIEKDGYVHFVFDFDIIDGDPVTVLDYADNYKKIEAVVIETDGPDLVIQGYPDAGHPDGMTLIIHRDQSFKPGAGLGDVGYMATLDYKNYKNYSIKCSQSGPVQLE